MQNTDRPDVTFLTHDSRGRHLCSCGTTTRGDQEERGAMLPGTVA